MTKRYRTYATENNARRYLRTLVAEWPGKMFAILPAPDGSFRFAVALVITSEDVGVRYAFCS